jgi:hypothetical protein
MLMVSFPVSADFVYSVPYPVLPILLNISMPACPKIMALEKKFSLHSQSTFWNILCTNN